MGFTLAGLLILSWAPDYASILAAAALVGAGSAVFHPESSRIARLASGGRHGLAQSIFQVGGSAGSAAGPLLAAWVIIPHGQPSLAWFGIAALLALAVLWKVGAWYQRHHLDAPARSRVRAAQASPVSAGRAAFTIAILLTLIFSKFFYLAGISSYYNFYLIEKFHLSVQSAQLYLFLFLLASAVGTLIGGAVGDRVGRKRVIWFSIFGVAPLTMVLPYAGLALDRGSERLHRPHPGVGLSRHRRLCAGTPARPGRRGLRVSSSASPSAWAASAPGARSRCRPPRRRIRLSLVRLPAAAGHGRGVAAEHRAAAARVDEFLVGRHSLRTSPCRNARSRSSPEPPTASAASQRGSSRRPAHRGHAVPRPRGRRRRS